MSPAITQDQSIDLGPVSASQSSGSIDLGPINRTATQAGGSIDLGPVSAASAGSIDLGPIGAPSPAALPSTTIQTAFPPAPAPGAALTAQGVNLPAVTQNALTHSRQQLGRDLTPDEVTSITSRVAGASPITPRELQVQQAQANASHNPIRAAVQGAKMALGAPLAVFSPEAHELAVHEQMVEHPVADTGLNKVAGIVGSSLPMAAQYAVSPALGVATSAVSGAGQARTEASQQRDLGNQVSGGQETAAALGYAIIDALNAHIGGKAFQGIGGNIATRIGVNVAAGAGGAGLSQLAKNVTAQQSIEPGRETMHNVWAATGEGAIGGSVFGTVGEGVRAFTPREIGPQATPRQLQTGRENRVVKRAVESKNAYDAQQAAKQPTAQDAPRVEPVQRSEAPAQSVDLGPVETPTRQNASEQPLSMAQRRERDNPTLAEDWAVRRRQIQARIRNGNDVLPSLLRPFEGEAWVEQYRAGPLKTKSSFVQDIADHDAANLAFSSQVRQAQDAAPVRGDAVPIGDIQAKRQPTGDIAPQVGARDLPVDRVAVPQGAEMPASVRASSEQAIEAAPNEIASEPVTSPKPAPVRDGQSVEPAAENGPRLSKAQSADHKEGFNIRRRALQQRIEEGRPVPAKALEVFRGESWADDHLAGRVPTKAAAEDSIASRRAEAESQLRETVAKEIGMDELLRGKPDALKIQIGRGDKSPGSAVPLEDAISHAETLPEDHHARLSLHNLRELEKNPDGLNLVKVNTNELPDGSRIQVNDKEVLTVDREMGTVQDGSGRKYNIPEDGIDLYGQRVLKPLEPDVNILRVDIDENTPASLFEAEKRASSGKLDDLEAWAKAKLGESRKRKAKAFSELTPQQRRRKGSAEGPFDPNELPYHAAILAAKLGKGAVRFAQWSRDMIDELGASVKRHLPEIWRQGRRLSKMGDEERAGWVLQKVHTPASETPKEAIRRSTGLGSVSKAVSETNALQASLRSQARGARAGYRAGAADERASQKNIAATAEASAPQSIPLSRAIKGQMQASAAAETRGVKRGWNQAVEEGSGIRSELVRIIKETLPPGERDPMLGAVAGAQTLADMNRAVHRLRGVLANHEVREATAQVERLTGKLKLDLPQRDSIRPELTEAEQAEALGKAKVAGIERRAMREIDINKIDPDYRDRIKPLIEQARSVKASLAGARTIDEKYAAIHSFRKVFNDLREIVIQHEMEKTERVGRDKATVEQRRNQIIRKIESQPQIDQPDAAENQMPKNRGFIRRLIGQRGATPQSIVQDLDGTFAHDGPAGEVLIKAPREAENNKRGEVRRFNKERGDALKAAGYEPGTRKLSQFLNEREAVELPNAGKVNLTRSQQVGAYAWYSDPDFRDRVQTHGRARFNFQNDLTADPIQLTPGDFEAIGQRLTPAERALKDTFFDGYNKTHLREQSIKANFELKGSAPETHDGYYGGRINYEKTPSAGEPPSMRQAKRALENIGEMQDRIPGDHQYIFPDFIHDTDRFIDHTASLIHSAKAVRIARMILEHPQMKRALRNRYGPSIQGELDRFILNLTDSPTPPSVDRGFANAMNRQFSRAALALNPRTFVNNIVGGTSMIFPFFDAKDYAAGVTGMFSHGVHERMTKASHIAADRWENPLYEQYTPLARDGEIRPKLSIGEGLRLAGESAAKLKPREMFAALDAAADSVTAMNVADSAPFRVAWAAAEHEVNRLHPDWTPEQKSAYVLDRFHDVVMRSQNGMTATETSGLWSDARSSVLLKPITFLRSDANKKLNLLIQARHADAATRAKILAALGMNVLTSSASRLVISGTAAGLVVNMLYGNQPTDKQKSKLVSNAAFKVLEDTAGLVPGANYLTDLARAAYQGQDFDMTDLPGIGAISDTANAGLSLGRSFMASDETPGKAKSRADRISAGLYRLTNALRTLAGDPTLPLTRDIVAAWDATEPPTSYAAPSAKDEFKKAVAKGDQALARDVLEKNRIGLPTLSRMIENADPDEAVELYAAGSDADRRSSRQALQDHIANSTKLSIEQKRELLEKAGIDAPPTLELEAELSQLRKRKASAAEAGKQAVDLLRKAGAAERAGDRSAAQSFRQEAGKLRGESQQSPADSARLIRIEQVQKSINNIRQQMDDGIVTKDAGEKRIQNLLRLAQPRKAA